MKHKRKMRNSCIFIALAALSQGTMADMYITPTIGMSYFSGGCESHELSCDTNDISFGATLGYQYSPNIAIELGYQHYGEVEATYPALQNQLLKADYSAKVQSAELGLAYSLPVADSLSLNLIGGAALWFVDMDGKELSYRVNKSSNGLSPYLGTSGSYKLSEQLSVDSGLKWVSSVGSSATGKSDIWQAFIGLTYRFPSNTSTASVPRTYDTEPLSASPSTSSVFSDKVKSTVKEEQSLTLYFDFDSSQLSPDSLVKLKSFTQGMSEKQSILIIASTDDTGTNHYNDNLSIRRAKSIRSALLHENIKKQRIKITALGEEVQSLSVPNSQRRSATIKIYNHNLATPL